jgi:hypothetical protein
MLSLLLVALLSSSPSMWANFVKAATKNVENEISNPVIDFKQCLLGDKEWQICRG